MIESKGLYCNLTQKSVHGSGLKYMNLSKLLYHIPLLYHIVISYTVFSLLRYTFCILDNFPTLGYLNNGKTPPGRGSDGINRGACHHSSSGCRRVQNVALLYRGRVDILWEECMIHLRKTKQKSSNHIVMLENCYALKIHECYCRKSLHDVIPGFIYKRA